MTHGRSPTRCWARPPAGTIRRSSAPRPAACPCSKRPSRTIWRSIPRGPPAPTGCTAPSSPTSSATGASALSTASPAGTWRSASTASAGTTAGRRPTGRSRSCALSTAVRASMWRACATRSISGSPAAASTMRRSGARSPPRRRCCRAGGPGSRRWWSRRVQGTHSASGSTPACASTRCCRCAGSGSTWPASSSGSRRPRRGSRWSCPSPASLPPSWSAAARKAIPWRANCETGCFPPP